MYAIKIENGKERIRVRHYNNGFLPSYTSCAEDSMGKRLYVVPGYIFMMTKAPGAEKVPDSEWKVIEAISDTHTSTLDVKAKKIIDGPLKDLLILRVNPSLKSVCIRAKLLGVTRDYWLAVRFKSAEEKADKAEKAEKADDGKAADVVKSRRRKAGEVKTMEYTQEQIDEILKRAEEVGIHQSAREYSVPWQKVQGWAKKAGVMDKVSKKPAKKKAASATTPAVEEKAEKKAEKPEKKTKKAKAAEAPVAEKKPAKQKKAAAAPVAEEKPKKAAPAAPATKPAEKTEPATDLAIENAVLRKENEQLKAKIEKLQKALAELM